MGIVTTNVRQALLVAPWAEALSEEGGMMEIPAGKGCSGCPFWIIVFDGGPDICANKELFTEELQVEATRSAECLSAYPNGAVITVTPKEVPCK